MNKPRDISYKTTFTLIWLLVLISFSLKSGCERLVLQHDMLCFNISHLWIWMHLYSFDSHNSEKYPHMGRFTVHDPELFLQGTIIWRHPDHVHMLWLIPWNDLII